MRLDLDLVVPPARDLGPVHLIGVGGAGMSGLAVLLHGRGLVVSGSDARESAALGALRAQGVAVHVGHDPTLLDGVRTVVVSSAVRESNPELARARADGLLVLHRSQALKALTRGQRVVAVAGTNGKTTTTAMLTVVLAYAGLDPSFSVGGELVSTGTSAGAGQGDLFVLEADESDGSFVVYEPDLAVVTNVQADHLDHYGSPEGVQRGFERFVRTIRPGGTLVACADDPGSARLAVTAAGRDLQVTTFGESQGADVRVSAVRLDGATTFDLHHPGARAGGSLSRQVRLQVPGRHNALNAAAAAAAALGLGVSLDLAVAGLESFTGTRRRFEARGVADGIRVFDDYAHNPAKVAAAVQTGRQAAGQARLVVVFQPHLFSRTRDFAVQFGAALGGADVVVVMDVYPAREDPVPGVSGELVARAVPLPSAQVDYVAERADTVDVVCGRLRAGDLLLTVGAGDVTLIAGQVLDRLRGDRGTPPVLAERGPSR